MSASTQAHPVMMPRRAVTLATRGSTRSTGMLRPPDEQRARQVDAVVTTTLGMEMESIATRVQLRGATSRVLVEAVVSSAVDHIRETAPPRHQAACACHPLLAACRQGPAGQAVTSASHQRVAGPWGSRRHGTAVVSSLGTPGRSCRITSRRGTAVQPWRGAFWSAGRITAGASPLRSSSVSM